MMTKKSGGYVATSDCFHVIYGWLDKGEMHVWSKTFPEIMIEMYDNEIVPNTIAYNKVKEILRSARTSKLSGPANCGLQYLINELRRSRFEMEEQNV